MARAPVRMDSTVGIYMLNGSVYVDVLSGEMMSRRRESTARSIQV